MPSREVGIQFSKYTLNPFERIGIGDNARRCLLPFFSHFAKGTTIWDLKNSPQNNYVSSRPLW